VTEVPERVSLSQRGAVVAWLPARSVVKLDCSRTPWPGVSIIAAYCDPGLVLSLMMTPALAHSWLYPSTAVWDSTLAVTPPSPGRGWCTK